jgi:hypothetical protein
MNLTIASCTDGYEKVSCRHSIDYKAESGRFPRQYVVCGRGRYRIEGNECFVWHWNSTNLTKTLLNVSLQSLAHFGVLTISLVSPSLVWILHSDNNVRFVDGFGRRSHLIIS